MKNRERGAALVETAIALPVILMALYGVSWAVRAGAVSERAESAVRYAGVISAQQNPYNDYSLYALYNNLGTESNVKTSACTKPTNLLVNGGTFPVVVPGTKSTSKNTPTFWLPEIITPFCAGTSVRQLYGAPTRSYLLLQSVPSMTTHLSDGGYFGLTLIDSDSTTQDKFYRSPDMSTLMHCASALSDAVSSSLAPLKYGTSTAKIAQLQPGDFDSTPISLSPSCTTGTGTQPIAPTPVPTTLAPGSSAPTATPGPAKSATAAPSPTPTVTPATPKPSATPTAAASPTPASSPSGGSGGGGGGGGGGGNPTPTPTPGNGGSPAPVGSPTGTPTGTPTKAPVTPAPTVTPATPKPSATPTATPTHTPVPSPSPSQPPGSIS